MLELLVLAIAPALFIFLNIYRKDRYEPEPLHLVARVFFLGALSVFPVPVQKFCTECGTSLEDGRSFCGNCGKRI